MTYTPKYFDSLSAAISRIRSCLRSDVMNSPEDEEIEYRLEEAELIVEDFLIAARFDVDNLSTAEKGNAMIMTIAQTLLFLIKKLPMSEDDKRDFELRVRDEFKEAAERFLRRVYIPSSVSAVYKRMEPGYGREWPTGA